MFENQRNNERPCVVFGAPDECPLWKEFHNKDKKLAKIEGWIKTGISLREINMKKNQKTPESDSSNCQVKTMVIQHERKSNEH